MSHTQTHTHCQWGLVYWSTGKRSSPRNKERTQRRRRRPRIACPDQVHVDSRQWGNLCSSQRASASPPWAASTLSPTTPNMPHSLIVTSCQLHSNTRQWQIWLLYKTFCSLDVESDTSDWVVYPSVYFAPGRGEQVLWSACPYVCLSAEICKQTDIYLQKRWSQYFAPYWGEVKS